MLVGIILAVGAAMLAMGGRRVAGIPVTDYTGYWWALLILGVILIIAGARVRRHGIVSPDERAGTRP
jgi:hypothetical protein